MTEDSLKLDISAAQLHKNLSDSEVLSSESNQTSSADVIPHITHYLKKNDTKYMPRPSIRQLHENHISHNIKDLFNDKSCPNKYLNIDESNKFGFISMVYIPTFMNLLGPSLFIRMGLVTANSGLFLALVEILLGTIILCGTVLSISALCSNGRVGCGGLYYLVSRNLGPEVGAVFGVIYFLTNAVMVSYSIAGITNQIQQILQDFNTGISEEPSGLNDQRIVGFICLFIIALIPFFGLDFQAKTQWFLFAFVLLAIIDFIIGAFIPPTPYQKVNGFVGWSARASKDNLIPVWESGIDFFAMFSIYMSGLCGDFTGVTMAEHLKNPKKAIPLGTLLAIITSQIIYIIQIIFYSCSVIRYATGKLDDYKFGNYSCTNQQPDCSSGLSNNEYIMSVMSALTHVGENTNYIEPIFTAGVLSQSISSALIAYITAPRVIQSLGFDGLLPYSKWFSKPYGRHGDPRRAYILTFFVSAIFVSISDFTPLAVTTTLCYLCAWFLINMSCFHTDYVASANWRPTFKYYNKWLSLIIGLLCIVVIFITKWYIGVILVAIMIFVYVFKISIWKSDLNWGQSSNAQIYKTAVSLAHKLNTVNQHEKNYRPSILLLCTEANNHMNLVSMADQITRHRGMLFIGDIISQRIPFESRIKTSEEWNKWFKSHKIKCFYKLISSQSLSNGSDMLIQCCGFSSYLSPNIVMIGFRNSWKQCSSDDINDYFNTIHNVFELNKSLIIYRDYKSTKYSIEKEKQEIDSKLKDPLAPRMSYQLKIKNIENVNHMITVRQVSKLHFIDIYWLYDDGGLTLLVPYILSQRKRWKNFQLRVFVIIDKMSNETVITEQNVSELLEKFRVEYYDIIVLELPEKSYYRRIEDIIESLSHDLCSSSSDTNELAISFQQYQDSTNKYVALRELLEEHSKYSQLIVMTIEIPRKDNLSAHIFMYWLDMLSIEMPEFLFIRGNQTNCLTIYID